MFRTRLLREAGLIHICKEVIQRNKAVVPGGEKTQRVWRKSGTFIHASASHYFMYWYKSILCFLRDGGSEWILTALATLRGGFLNFTCNAHFSIFSSVLISSTPWCRRIGLQADYGNQRTLVLPALSNFLALPRLQSFPI